MRPSEDVQRNLITEKVIRKREKTEVVRRRKNDTEANGNTGASVDENLERRQHRKDSYTDGNLHYEHGTISWLNRKSTMARHRNAYD